MTTTLTHCILPTGTIAETLYQEGLQFFGHDKKSSLSKKGAIDVTHCIAEGAITNILYWTMPLNIHQQLDCVLSSYLQWWDYPNKEMCDQYYEAVIDSNECAITNLIADVIDESKRWHLWHTHRIHEDLFVAQGEDYRIVEFEQRVLSGSIRVNARTFEHVIEKNNRY